MAKIGAIHYNWPGCDLEGFARRASEIGYRYCELQIRDIWDGESKNGEQTAAATRELLAKYGMQASAVAAGNDFLQARSPRLGRANRALPLRLPDHPHNPRTDIVRSDGGWNRTRRRPRGPVGRHDARSLQALRRFSRRVRRADRPRQPRNFHQRRRLAVKPDRARWLGPTRRQFGHHELPLVRSRTRPNRPLL